MGAGGWSWIKSLRFTAGEWVPVVCPGLNRFALPGEWVLLVCPGSDRFALPGEWVPVVGPGSDRFKTCFLCLFSTYFLPESLKY